MFRTSYKTAGALLGAAFLALGTTSAKADHFRSLTGDHTSYGMAQFHYMNLSGEPGDENNPGKVLLRLRNPVHVDQAAATIVYTRAVTRWDDWTPTEVYQGCRVDVLTPHGSIGIRAKEIPPFTYPDWSNRYVEIIWAPLERVTVTRTDGSQTRNRRANGLGGWATRRDSGTIENAFAAHPAVFSLPNNFERKFPWMPDSIGGPGDTENQRERALLCICGEVNAQGLDRLTFAPFGITCPEDPVF